MNICLASINNKAYSETFIQAQIDNLPVVLVLHSGMKPRFYDDNTPIVPKILLILEKIINKIVRKKIFFITDYFCVKLLKKKKINAVLAQYGTGGVGMLPVCKKANIPLFVHFHGFDASSKPILKEFENGYKLMFREAAAIISVSSTMTKGLVALGCPKSKIVQNTYGVNDSFLKITPHFKSKIFLAVGRFVRKKAPHLTILAFKEVLKYIPDAQLVMVGDGYLLSTCESLSKEHNLEHAITFAGVLERFQIQAYMHNAIAFVQHSVIDEDGDSEGTPVSILEAQAAGLPVISTIHAGIPDVVIDGETGFLVSEGDIAGMAQFMIRVLKNTEMAKKMGFAAKERIKNHFTMQMYNTKLMEALEYGVKNHA
jgi:colanic acid/amylovoran biosynthesis glycosyltransferase